jgi:hypothetical protein
VNARIFDYADDAVSYDANVIIRSAGSNTMINRTQRCVRNITYGIFVSASETYIYGAYNYNVTSAPSLIGGDTYIESGGTMTINGALGGPVVANVANVYVDGTVTDNAGIANLGSITVQSNGTWNDYYWASIPGSVNNYGIVNNYGTH